MIGENEVSDLLRRRFGERVGNKAASRPEENDNRSNGDDERPNELEKNHERISRDITNNAGEVNGRRRSSLEIQELLAQRFGSIRR